MNYVFYPQSSSTSDLSINWEVLLSEAGKLFLTTSKIPLAHPFEHADRGSLLRCAQGFFGGTPNPISTPNPHLVRG